MTKRILTIIKSLINATIFSENKGNKKNVPSKRKKKLNALNISITKKKKKKINQIEIRRS